MAKFYGAVGFIVPMETAPDVYTETPVARYYMGDVVRNVKKATSGEGINDNIDVNNQISIVADPFAFAHFFAMRYVEWMGRIGMFNLLKSNPPSNHLDWRCVQWRNRVSNCLRS